MSDTIRRPNPSGQLLPNNRPDLVLVLGSDAWEGRLLTAEHERYPTFWNAWMSQGVWGRLEHERFWRMHLRDWPRKSGQQTPPDIVERIAALQRDGLSKAAIAKELHYAEDGLPKGAWQRASARNLPGVQRPPMIARGLFAQELAEEMLVDRVKATGDDDAVYTARYKIRNCWRTPRVVDADDLAAQRGHDERTWLNELGHPDT